MIVIYSDDDIDVYFLDGAGSEIAITLSNWTRLNPKPLWERETSGLPAVYVVAKWNHWYQCDGIVTAADVIKRKTSDYQRIVTLGSSMGGFAALALAPAVGATRAVAVSPQFSSDRALTPFETRWREDIAKIAAHRLHIEPADVTRHLLYDPQHSQDAKHADLIMKAVTATAWPLPFSGHPSGFALDDIGLMKSLVETSVLGNEDKTLFSNLSQRYAIQSHLSATVILNNYKHGDKSLLPPSRSDPVLGNQQVREQVLALIP